ncbi:MAG: 50S ribosomal protein L15 [Nitrospirae bacterium GWD2_57_9]|nr:MAG: 50S ribosomal protein L15 [Nitrospirae bacterium GWD2_57_9]OGW47448.1 MAG: 50S ribosomal protein L15 [Nitrospirae bacterium GWC2_57_9]
MRLEELKPSKGATKKAKRVGRGPGSGSGKTAAKGHKGQKARSGGVKGAGFEGGQMPLQRRIPKRGFTNIFRKEYAIVNLSDLADMTGSEPVTPEMLKQNGMIDDMKDGLKVLGTGDLKSKLTVRAHKFSKSAIEKIQAAGGKAEVI